MMREVRRYPSSRWRGSVHSGGAGAAFTELREPCHAAKRPGLLVSSAKPDLLAFTPARR